MPPEFSFEERFGGRAAFNLAKYGFEGHFAIGRIITGEGPGDGAAFYPWQLDRYERVMRLRPGETWLLKRLIKHAWELGRPVYISLHKTEIEADVSRSTLQKWMHRLEELHYIELVSEGRPHDPRRVYDVSGTYVALAICIMADPTSKLATDRGNPIPVKLAKSLRKDDEHCFDLDFQALERLAQRKDEALDWDWKWIPKDG